MISRYFVMSEFIGWIGVAIFAVNSLIMMAYYGVILFAKNKRVSKIWIGINAFLEASQITVVCLFIVMLYDPQSISGQGKLDQFTAEAFIKLSIACIVVSGISTIFILATESLWGAFIKKDKIWISLVPYKRGQFKEYKKIYKFGNKVKWKWAYKNTKTGLSIKDFVKK